LKVLLLGQNSYLSDFYLKFSKNKFSNITIYTKRFDHSDIINLNDILFYDKYFSLIDINFDYSLNFIHIHKSSLASEIDINTKLSKKLIYVFNKLKIKRNIYISSVNAFSDTKSEYGIAKLRSEEVYKSLGNFVIIRPSTIIDIDYKNKLILGGKKGKSFKSLNKLITKFFFIPVPGFGKYLQTVCFGDDLGKFIDFIINNNLFYKRTINFFTGEIISYNDFLDIYFNFKKIKRFKLYIPKILIIFIIKFLKIVFRNLNISSKNIDNLTNQKIEFNLSQDINKLIKLKKINDLN
jgi:hypothetical protein